MAIDDRFELRLAARLNSVVMYNRWRAIQTAGPGSNVDADFCAQMFIARILPKIQALQAFDVEYLYLYTRIYWPSKSWPVLMELPQRGYSLSQSLPASSSLILTGYVYAAPTVHRGSFRLGGIAEEFNVNGVLTDGGRVLADTLGNAFPAPQSISGRTYEFGMEVPPFAFQQYDSMQARSALSTQRPRKQLPGTTP